MSLPHSSCVRSFALLSLALLASTATAQAPAGPEITGQELAGRSPAYVGAAGGKAFVLDVADGTVAVRTLRTALRVHKSFGLDADARRLLYRPLSGDAPSGDLVVEDLVTGAIVRLESHFAIEAAWSPRDPDQIAYTFASGEGFGVALAHLRTGRTTVLRSAQVLADQLLWEGDGSGIYYYRSEDRERVGTEAETGDRIVEHSYAVLTPTFHPVASASPRDPSAAREVAPAALPSDFPVLAKPVPDDLAEPVTEAPASGAPVRLRRLESAELPADLYAFRLLSPGLDREISGGNLLGDGPLSLRGLRDGKTRSLGEGRVLKVLDGGVLLRRSPVAGGSIDYVPFDGPAAAMAAAAPVAYSIPYPGSAYVGQGGQSYPSPGCSTYYTHTASSSMGYAYDFSNSGRHILASAPGTAVYVKGDVTCNKCAPRCADYVPGCTANSGWGNVVILEHADGTFTKYTHMAPNSPRVVLGQSVCAGLWIGTQGHTGCTNGSVCGDHLHFQRQSSSALSGRSLAVDFAETADPLACYRTYTSANTERAACSNPCQTASVPADHWKGEYFANTTLAGVPSLVRDDGTGPLAFDWGTGSPGATCGLGVDNFSARFTRTLSFAAGAHRFTITSDDGFRLYVDHVLRKEAWVVQAPATYTVDVPLTAGAHTVRLEYFEAAGGATVRLSWQIVQGVTEFVCEDGDACFAQSGPVANWRKATTCGSTPLGYAGDMLWTYVNGTAVQNSVRWTPALGGPGTYAVSVYVPRCNGTSRQATYRIVHNGITETRTINQYVYSDVWVSLGSFAFSGAAGEYVELTDATGEAASTNRQLAFDAVRWTRQ